MDEFEIPLPYITCVLVKNIRTLHIYECTCVVHTLMCKHKLHSPQVYIHKWDARVHTDTDTDRQTDRHTHTHTHMLTDTPICSNIQI